MQCSTIRLLFGTLVIIALSWFATLVYLMGYCTVNDPVVAAHQKYVDRANEHLHIQRSDERPGSDPHTAAMEILLVTPTYARLVQKAELTRLSHTFCLAAIRGLSLRWIVIEDATSRSAMVSALLAAMCKGADGMPLLSERSEGQLRYVHLFEPTPATAKLRPHDPNWLLPRGVLQRSAALNWLRATYADQAEPARGVVYFADDDNTYDLGLFDEMRLTRKVSVWPVGTVGYLKYESPIVRGGKVVGWYTYWYREQRRFAMDMAGFAINLNLIIEHPDVKFSLDVQRGFQESVFLTKLGITMDDLEPRAENCTKVLVWHTRSETPSLKNERKMSLKYNETYPVDHVEV